VRKGSCERSHRLEVGIAIIQAWNDWQAEKDAGAIVVQASEVLQYEFVAATGVFSVAGGIRLLNIVEEEVDEWQYALKCRIWDITASFDCTVQTISLRGLEQFHREIGLLKGFAA